MVWFPATPDWNVWLSDSLMCRRVHRVISHNLGLSRVAQQQHKHKTERQTEGLEKGLKKGLKRASPGNQRRSKIPKQQAKGE